MSVRASCNAFRCATALVLICGVSPEILKSLPTEASGLIGLDRAPAGAELMREAIPADQMAGAENRKYGDQ